MTTSPDQSGASSTPETSASSPAMTADLAAEINAAMETSIAGAAAHHHKPGKKELDAAHAAMGDRPKIRGPRVVEGGREKRKGAVVSVGPTDIFIEFGPKELGVVPRIQFPDEADLPKVGGEVEVVVERFEPAENLFICNRPGVVQKAAWEMLEPGTVVEALVTGVNKGGLELEVAQHAAFMPASQVALERIEDFTPFIGQKLTCKVVRVDRTGRGQITLSRRDILNEQRREAVTKLKGELKEGDIREGVVKKIMQFGAFVDIGGIDGLLHVSDLSHDRVKKVEDILKEGDKVTVKVLKLDWENKRHSLGLKQLQEDPWAAAIKDLKEGDETSGRVTKLAEFGCFVELAPGVEGLVHISEMAWTRVQKVSDVVQPNKVVKVRVLKMEAGSKKISLSIKQTLERPAGEQRGPRTRREEEFKPEVPETPAARRLREAAKAKHGKQLKSGLGGANLGLGLGDLKL